MTTRHTLPTIDPRDPSGRWNLLIPGLRVLLRVLFACAALVGFGLMRSHASHLSGAELTHTCLGNGQYRFTLTLYRDCAGIPIGSQTQTLQLQNPCGAPGITLSLPLAGSQDVSQLCPQDLGASTCNGGNLPGTQAFTFVSAPITLAPCDSWTIAYTSSVEGTRNQAVLNLVSPGFALVHVSSTLNTLAVACDQSPVVSGAPIPYVCLNTPVSYSFGATDADGHTLSYALVAARSSAANTIIYQPPHSPAAPIPGVQLDPGNGLLTFTPTQVGSFVVVVEIGQFAANGVLVGTVQRDIQFVVVPCLGAPPDPHAGAITGLTGTAQQDGPRELGLCGNGSFCFTATYTDSDPGSSLLFSSTVEQVLPGATVSISGTNPLVATICWNGVTGTSGTMTFTVTISDCSPGSLAILQDYTYTVLIDQNDPLQLITAGDVTANCPGDVVEMELVTIQGGAPPFAITWTDAQGSILGNAATQQVPVAQPSSFTATVTDQCGQSSSIVVNTLVAQHAPLAISTSGDTSVLCPGDAASFTVQAITGGVAPYTTTWTDVQGTVLSSSPTITASIQQSTSFTVSVNDQCGTSASRTITATTQALAPFVLTTSPDRVRCDDEEVLLEALVSGGAEPTTLFWVELGSTAPSVTVAPAVPTSFTVIATDACGNAATGVIQVDIERPEVTIMAVELGNEQWLFQGLTTLTVATFEWNFGDGHFSQVAGPQHRFTSGEPQVVELTITTVNGCVASDTTLIVPAGQVFFPNTFTPDGDGINDHFGPVGQGALQVTFRVFDRWGAEVFAGQGLDAAWDGRLPNGAPAPTGVYVVQHEVREEGRPAQRGTGHVTLLRGEMAAR